MKEAQSFFADAVWVVVLQLRWMVRPVVSGSRGSPLMTMTMAMTPVPHQSQTEFIWHVCRDSRRVISDEVPHSSCPQATVVFFVGVSGQKGSTARLAPTQDKPGGRQTVPGPAMQHVVIGAGPVGG